jgi:hypothetical protein
VLRVAADYVFVRKVLADNPLPAAVGLAGKVKPSKAGAGLAVMQVSRAVDRCLLAGPLRTRCLIRAVVLHRMLRRQGLQTSVVIGLPDAAATTDAHAWVELDGRDLGPAPGRAGHRELVRYS